MRFRLQVIVDQYRPIEELAKLFADGVDCIQVRIRDESTLRLVEYTSAIVEVCHARGVIALVNRRLDVVLATEAQGVQLPSNGFRPSEVRRVASDLLIGSSVHSIDKAIRAANDGTDSITFGHVFASGSHPSDPPRGVEMLRNIVDVVDVPIVAIGGIGPRNVELVREAGATSISVIGAIWNAHESERTKIVQLLRKGIEG